MSDRAEATAAGHRHTVQLDSALTVGCSISQTGQTTLTLAGELDAASADQAYRYVRDAIDTHGGPVMLDVAGLSFCDARGLAALVRMSRHAKQAGSFLHLVAPPPRLVKLMRIVGLDEELPVHREDRTAEVASVRPEPPSLSSSGHGDAWLEHPVWVQHPVWVRWVPRGAQAGSSAAVLHAMPCSRMS
jgi:anti-sigma B factor antagonist